MIIVTCIGVVVGTILLIVPGLFLATIWAVSSPAIVFERLSVGSALQRSAALTEGFRWPVFGIVIVFFLASAIIGNAFDHGRENLVHGLNALNFVSGAVREVINNILKCVFALVAAVGVFSRAAQPAAHGEGRRGTRGRGDHLRGSPPPGLSNLSGRIRAPGRPRGRAGRRCGPAASRTPGRSGSQIDEGRDQIAGE